MTGWTSTLLPRLSDFGVPLPLVDAVRGQLQLAQHCLPVQELWVGLLDDCGWQGWGPAEQLTPLPRQILLLAVDIAPAGQQALWADGRWWHWVKLRVAEPWTGACLLAWRGADDEWTSQHQDLWHLLAQLVEQQLQAWHVRTQAAEAARSQAKLRAVFDTALDAIVAVDEDGQIVQVNAAAERMFGSVGEALIDRPIRGLFATAPGALGALALPEWVGRSVEAEGLRSDGCTFPLEAAVGEALTEDGRFYVAVLRDLSALRRVDRLERELVTTVSHELRTPLTSIRGTLGLLLGGVAGELGERTRHLLEVAQRNCNRLSLLIDDLLDMERLMSGQMRLDVRLYDAYELARQSVEQHLGYAAQHGAEVILEPGPSGLLVTADANRMAQILGNLLSNAIKFTGQGRQVWMSVATNREGLVWAVRDQGPGIPAEFAPRLFQRFAQADASDARPKGGTGLGLSIAKALVELHGGAIGYANVAGGGSEFWVWLPAAAPPEGMG